MDNSQIINHEEAFQLASIREHESNLARAYIDLVNILVNITHHPGALEEFEPKWGPIVDVELNRRMLEDSHNN